MKRADTPFRRVLAIDAVVYQCSIDESEERIRLALGLIADAVLSGRRVAIPGFGIFTLRKRKAKRVLAPNGVWMRTPPVKTIGFRPSKAVKL